MITSIYVRAFDPLVSGYTNEYLGSRQPNAYSHRIGADKGFLSASMSIAIRRDEFDDWLQNGLGRHILVLDSSGITVWEGFVNTVSASLGTLQVTVGPVVDIANRVSCKYTPIIDVSVDPPIKGDTTTTIITQNLVSQGIYGIWEKILTVGEVIDDPIVGTNDAEEIRDTYLAEFAYPAIGNELSIGGTGSEPMLTLECLGYYEWLGAYVYNNTVSPVSTQASVKIASVIDADPNNFFSSANAQIDFNGTLVPSYEDEDRFANDVLEGITSMGDASGNRWLISVLEDRKVYYTQIPTTFTYYHNVFLSPQRITLANNVPIELWNIRPGKWLLMPDIISPTVLPTTPDPSDRRVLFIQEITFTAPDQISLSGVRINTVDQKINRLGIGGML